MSLTICVSYVALLSWCVTVTKRNCQDASVSWQVSYDVALIWHVYQAAFLSWHVTVITYCCHEILLSWHVPVMMHDSHDVSLSLCFTVMLQIRLVSSTCQHMTCHCRDVSLAWCITVTRGHCCDMPLMSLSWHVTCQVVLLLSWVSYHVTRILNIYLHL